MSQEEITSLAEAILAHTNVEGFALVLGLADQTVVLLNNVSPEACGKLLLKSGRDISGEEQRPALFN